MSSAHTQDKRLLRLFTPLGSDVLIPVSAHGEEVLSDGFIYTLDAFSEDRTDLQSRDLVGQRVTFALVQHSGALRYFNGYVTGLVSLGLSHNGQRAHYRLTLQSWLHFLNKGADCRIFQDQSIPDVLTQVFAPLGPLADFRFELKHPHVPFRYLTQYNESSGNFTRRLLRLDGIGYRIEHTNGSHTVCFFDDAESLPALTPQPVLQLQSVTTANDYLSSWLWHSEFATGQYSQRSYNYKTPAQPLTGEAIAPDTVTELARAARLENYRYAETYTDADGAQRHTDHAMSQAVQRHQRAHGAGTYRHLEPGRCFSVVQVPGGSWWQAGQEFLLTRTRFAADDRGEPVFTIDIEAAPSGTRVYPEAETVRIDSLQSAIVTGPKGEEIHTDDLGRIKVRFHWDRDSERPDEKSSCWLRVMQSFAGPDFGAQFTPRIGQEVTVAFENGNPDRPFVLGALYHAEHEPPYKDNRGSRTGLQTRSTKGGSASTRNELAFEDSRGKEEFFIQAERDLNARIKHDDSRFIGNDLDLNIKGDKTVIVAGDDTHSIEEELSYSAGQRIIFRVGSSEIEINGSEVVMRSPKVFIDGAAMPIGVTPPSTERPYRVEIGPRSQLSSALNKNTSAAPKKNTPTLPKAGTPDSDNNVSGSHTSTPVKENGDPVDTGLGDEVNALASKSPSLQQDLKDLKSKGWEITYGTPGAGSFPDRNASPPTIILDGNLKNDPSSTTQALAHEVGHATYPHVPDLTSKAAYVDGHLANEGAATLNNIKVQREIIANGGKDIGISGNSINHPAYNKAYDAYVADKNIDAARKTIGEIFRNGEIMSTTGKPYGVNHEEWYDRTFPPKN